MNKTLSEPSSPNSAQDLNSSKRSDPELLKRKKIKTLKIKKAKIYENSIRQGKWDKEEHKRFLEICLKHGNNWPKIQEILETRTCAQIRSHAQKFIIKLCKKYQIKIKSKKFRNKKSKHLNFVYKKKVVNPRPVEPEDQMFLDLFNYYKREQKSFLIEKIHNGHESSNCPFNLRKLKRLENSLNKNAIWKINKTANEESNLLFIPNQSIIQSDNSFNDLNVYDLNFKTDYFKDFSNYQKNNCLRKNSNSVKFSSSCGTPNKVNSTFYSFNSKNNQNQSFNSRKFNLNDLNEFSNEDNSLNAFFKSNLSSERTVPVEIEINKPEEQTKNLRKSFFNNLKKENREEINIIGKASSDYFDTNKQKELNRNNNNNNFSALASKDGLYFLNELQFIKNYNQKTISFLKVFSNNYQLSPIQQMSNYNDNFICKYNDTISIFDLMKINEIAKLSNNYNHNKNSDNNENFQFNNFSGYALFN